MEQIAEITAVNPKIEPKTNPTEPAENAIAAIIARGIGAKASSKIFRLSLSPNFDI